MKDKRLPEKANRGQILEKKIKKFKQMENVGCFYEM